MYDFLSHTTHDVSAEVYVADFGLARAQEAEGQVATTKQNFGPISVCIATHPSDCNQLS